MNKTEMAAKLAKKVDITQTQAGDIVDAIFSTESGKGIIAVELDAPTGDRIARWYRCIKQIFKQGARTTHQGRGAVDIIWISDLI